MLVLIKSSSYLEYQLSKIELTSVAVNT